MTKQAQNGCFIHVAFEDKSCITLGEAMNLKGQCHEIFCFWSNESVSPQPQSIPLEPFRIFSKIRGDICKSRWTTGINDTGGKFCHHFR
jgi:hypothetical protein